MLTIPTPVRALATAALLAVALASVPTDFAHARINVEDTEPPTSVPGQRTNSTQARQKSPQQQACEAQGYQWISGQCANKHCYHNGTWYRPGGYRLEGGHHYACDGVSGTWVQIYRGPSPDGIRAPTTGTSTQP